jgi:hypothetical protein
MMMLLITCAHPAVTNVGAEEMAVCEILGAAIVEYDGTLADQVVKTYGPDGEYIVLVTTRTP